MDKIEINVYAPDYIKFNRIGIGDCFFGILKFCPYKAFNEEEMKEILKMLCKRKLKLTIEEAKDEI